MKCDLEPGAPKDGEEADVAEKVVDIGDGVIRSEGGKIGNEEQIEEEFDAVGFVTLREDKTVTVGTDKGRLDQWCGLVKTREMLLCVAASMLVAISISLTGLRHTRRAVSWSVRSPASGSGVTYLVAVESETHVVLRVAYRTLKGEVG